MPTYRKTITIHADRVAGSHAGFLVLVSLDDDPDLIAHARPDGSDIRFEDAAGNALPFTICRASDVPAPGGAWTWPTGTRAIVTTGGKRVFGWVNSRGDVGVDSHDPATGTRTTFTFHEQLQVDDHNNPSFLQLHPDGPQAGKLLAAYSYHNGDSWSRRSTAVDDASDWEDAVATDTGGESLDSYAHLIQLPADGHRVYWFFRRWGATKPHHFRTSDDGGDTWTTHEAPLFQTGGQRPYVLSERNGDDRIDFALSSGHPNETTNSIYHFYMRVVGGVRRYYRSDGTEITRGGGTTSGDDVLPITPDDLTPIWDGATQGNCWIGSLVIHGGVPTLALVHYVDEDTHHWYQARLSGGAWATEFVCDGGDGVGSDYLPGSQWAPGGLAIDPDDPDTVYVSRSIDDTQQIQRWDRAAPGDWSKAEDLTRGAGHRSARPYLVRGADPDFRLGFFRGFYASFNNYRTHVHFPARVTSRLRAYVRLPELTDAEDTTIHLLYGDPDAPGGQDVAATFDFEADALGAQAAASLWWMGDYDLRKVPRDARFQAGLDLAGLEALTVESWINYRADGASADYYVGSNFGAATASAMLRHARSSPAPLRSSVVDASNTTRNTTGPDVTAGTWHLAAVVADGAAGSVRTAADGVSGEPGTFTDGMSATSGGNWFWGQRASADIYEGLLRGSRVSALARSDDWLLTRYNNEFDPATFYEVGAEFQFLAPGILSAGTPTHNSVTLSWTDATGGVGPVTAQLQRSPSGLGDWADVPGSSPVTDTGLTPETAYDYRVTWTDANDNTVTSNVVTITTRGVPSASRPTRFASTAVRLGPDPRASVAVPA